MFALWLKISATQIMIIEVDISKIFLIDYAIKLSSMFESLAMHIFDAQNSCQIWQPFINKCQCCINITF